MEIPAYRWPPPQSWGMMGIGATARGWHWEPAARFAGGTAGGTLAAGLPTPPHCSALSPSWLGGWKTRVLHCGEKAGRDTKESQKVLNIFLKAGFILQGANIALCSYPVNTRLPGNCTQTLPSAVPAPIIAVLRAVTQSPDNPAA